MTSALFMKKHERDPDMYELYTAYSTRNTTNLWAVIHECALADTELERQLASGDPVQVAIISQADLDKLEGGDE